MRTLTTSFLLLLFVACNGQDTVCYVCYTPEQWDSAQAAHANETDSLKLFYEQEIQAIGEAYQNPELYGDTEMTLYDSTDTKVVLKKTGSDLYYDIYENEKRYRFWIVDRELEIWIGDTTRANLFLQYPFE